jgi:DNA-binding CsgD family transcriptional regulator
MGQRERNRCRERLEVLAAAGLDAEEGRRAAIAELHRAVGFERWCWPMTDPASGLSTSGIGEFDFWPSLPTLVALEEHGDVTSKPRLVLGRRASLALSVATGGELTRSRRWRECLRPYGIGDELMTACRDRHGCWGSVELMRDSGDRPFNEDDVRLLDALAPTLGTLLRRGVRAACEADAGEARPRPPGTLILDAQIRPASWTPPVREWLSELPGAEVCERFGILPTAIYEIGARVLTPPDAATGLPTHVRIRGVSGRWSVVEGARLEGDDRGRVAVTVRAATSDEVFDLLCRAYALTRRERELAAVMLGGLATIELARTLDISPYTVQDHLKSMFEKTGVRSRRELLSLLAGHIRGAHPFDADDETDPARGCSSANSGTPSSRRR